MQIRVKEESLCFPLKDGKVLLGLRSATFANGFWNGFGGGVKVWENPEDSAIRELMEEAMLSTGTEFLRKVAILEMRHLGGRGGNYLSRVHTYLIKKWYGEPRETKEMKTPTWFKIGNLPFDQMMPADRVWLPIALSGQQIVVEASIGKAQRNLSGAVNIQKTDFSLMKR